MEANACCVGVTLLRMSREVAQRALSFNFKQGFGLRQVGIFLVAGNQAQ